MSPADSVVLVDLIGFIAGAALYGMLLAMVVGPRAARASSVDRLALLTAFLGLLWNLGELTVQILRSAGVDAPSEGVEAFAYIALGFLPAVVVHSALVTGEATGPRGARLTTGAAYGLSTIAGLLHVLTVVDHSFAHLWSLRVLTIGFCALIIALAIITRGQPKRRRAVWALSLALFAVSALHLSRHVGNQESNWVEIVGHHASLPLAFAILYQDYRFALADLFLKRALTLLVLTALVCGLYVLGVAPLLGPLGPAPGSVAILLSLWVATALAAPLLREAVTRFVDSAILRRPDFNALASELAREFAALERPAAMLDRACERLAPALLARSVAWASTDVDGEPAEAAGGEHFLALLPGDAAVLLSEWTRREGWVTLPDARALAASSARSPEVVTTRAVVTVPTVEPPTYVLLVSQLGAGRRVMSDDLAFLNAVASALARRIDAVRVAHVRCQHELREQETSKLATEAELRALRAQINPHFLFNALTTIGYLIQTSPERALDTLMRLTELLRAVLRSSGEFGTLGEEVELVEAYLDIERERFEERLEVRLDVPEALRALRVPSLVVQPLVENAIKHGISPGAAGGVVTVRARLDGSPGEQLLVIEVVDTGVGASASQLEAGRLRGVGLENVARRLEGHYGAGAWFDIDSSPGRGTTATLRVPVASAVEGRRR